jgi:hypothetical protein
MRQATRPDGVYRSPNPAFFGLEAPLNAEEILARLVAFRSVMGRANGDIVDWIRA